MCIWPRKNPIKLDNQNMNHHQGARLEVQTYKYWRHATTLERKCRKQWPKETRNRIHQAVYFPRWKTGATWRRNRFRAMMTTTQNRKYQQPTAQGARGCITAIADWNPCWTMPARQTRAAKRKSQQSRRADKTKSHVQKGRNWICIPYK